MFYVWSMIAVNYPEPRFKIKAEQDQHYIFDAIRKKWLLLTEEEWVRQNFVAYLVAELRYPAAMIALEKGLLLNDLKKRFDVLVYDGRHQPWMLVECKAPSVPLNEKVLNQVLRYNMSIPVPFIVITNGAACFGWQKAGEGVLPLTQLPAWA